MTFSADARRCQRGRGGQTHQDENGDSGTCEGSHGGILPSTQAWRRSPGPAARHANLEPVTLCSLRRSALALAVAVTGWAAGCAIAPQPMVDPGYAARAYTPARVAVLPPDVFVVVDQFGDNDPAQSAALGQKVSADIVRLAEQALRARGYDVDLSSRWDGVYGQDGAVLVSRDEIGGSPTACSRSPTAVKAGPRARWRRRGWSRPSSRRGWDGRRRRTRSSTST